MNIPTFRRPLLALVSLTILTFASLASAEPPSRVARLGYFSGTVSFSPAGEADWVQAVVNRPLTTGDRLWADANSRAELQIGGAAIRLGAGTSVTLLNLDDRIAQLELSQGTLKVRVRRLGRGQSFEVNTPNLAFTLRQPGDYRIDVDPNTDSTVVTVQSGEAEVYGEGTSYVVNPHGGYRFYGTGLSDYDTLTAPRDDDLDRWAGERDRRVDHSLTARYVSSEVVGYEDLDANGTWRADPNYGNVWTPNRVAAGWTPYHDGHWAWIDPWGWTWVDDAPWGFAVSHYGRWANFGGSWGWVPGPPREQAVYAPALVVFVGGKNFQTAQPIGSSIAGAVGWFPLAPREVYRPSYPVSRVYFDHINRSNAVIAPTTITNVYNTTNVTNVTTNVTKVVYVNQRVAGAVVAVPAQAFVQSQSVAKAAMPVSKEAAISAPVAHVAAVAPVQLSLHGGAPSTGAKPPAHEHAVVARSVPPPPPIPFAAQQTQLAAKPGVPIDEVRRTQLKPAAPAVLAPKVSVVNTIQAPTPTAVPPTTPPAGKSPEGRKADAARADAAKAEAARAEAAKADAAKADTARAAAARGEASRADAAKAEAARAEAAKADAAKADAARAAAARGEASRADAAKAEAARAAAARGEASRADAARTEAARAEAAKADAVKADAARAAAARGEASRADAARAEAARAEAAKADAAKADAARAAAARGAASRADAARAEAARADAARAAAARPATPPPPPKDARAPAAKREPDTRAEEEKKRAEEESRKR
jgi:hypothetical protein